MGFMNLSLYFVEEETPSTFKKLGWLDRKTVGMRTEISAGHINPQTIPVPPRAKHVTTEIEFDTFLPSVDIPAQGTLGKLPLPRDSENLYFSKFNKSQTVEFISERVAVTITA